MAVNIFSLEGNLQVTGIAEAKAGLEGVTAAGKETTAALNATGPVASRFMGELPAATAKQMAVLSEAEASFKKMGLAGKELDTAMVAAARGMGVSLPPAAGAAEAAMMGAAGASSAMGKETEAATEKVKKSTEAHHSLGRGILETIERYRGLIEIYGVMKVVEFTAKAIEQAASLHELSQKTGASVEMLSMLEFAGRRANVTSENLAIGFRGLSLALGNLRDGQDKTVAAFGRLGLSAKDFEGINTDEAFKKIVEAMRHLPDGLEKSEVAARVFGRSGALLIPLLDDLGKKGFAATAEEARKFHALFGTDLATAADDLKDKWGDLKFSLMALAREAIPPLTKLINLLTTLATMTPTDVWHKEWVWVQKIAAVASGNYTGLAAINAAEEARAAAANAPTAKEMRDARGLSKGLPFTPFGSLGGSDNAKDANPQGTEISLLKEKFELDRAGAKDLTRLFELEGQLTRALDHKNLSMKEELRLARDLAEARQAIAAALPPLDAPDKLAGGQYAPVGQKGRLDLSGYLGGMVAPLAGSGEVSADDPAYMKGATFMQNLGKGLSDGLAKMRPLANGLTQMFQNIFNHASVGLSIAHFGKTILAGLGSIFVQMAAKAILAAPLFTAIGHAMSNPFTAGPALLAFGIALTALGAAMGGAAHGDGGGGGGAGGIGRDQITQIHLTADGAGGFIAPHRPDQPVINVIGHKTAMGARLIAESTATARRLGHKV